jgi:hypothetical protein
MKDVRDAAFGWFFEGRPRVVEHTAPALGVFDSCQEPNG